MKIGQEMGLNAGHAIYVSELPLSGDFNVALVVRFENMAQREKGNDPETKMSRDPVRQEWKAMAASTPGRDRLITKTTSRSN